jgi:hypothetical protein
MDQTMGTTFFGIKGGLTAASRRKRSSVYGTIEYAGTTPVGLYTVPLPAGGHPMVI